jgi:[acyl-carrier-protein] S-malonyltransferase
VPTPEAGATGAGAGGVLAFLYPGPGTERVGMGAWARREACARPVFELMSDVTGVDVARLCDAGPIEQLAAGEPAAAAAFATGVAAHLVLESRGVRPAAVAGVSAGEACALWAAGVLDLEDAARLVAARSRLVAACPGSGAGAMALVEGLAPTTVEQLCSACARHDVLVVAIAAGPRHSVVSGIAAAVDRLLVAAYRAGARRARRWPGADALHSPCLRPAHEPWIDVVASVRLRAPQLPLALGATGELAEGVAAVRSGLAAHLVAPVRWQRCVERLAAAGVEGMVECGDGRSLDPVHRSIAPGVPMAAACDPGAVVELDERGRRRR